MDAMSLPDVFKTSTLRIGVLLPEVLGTYGDGGNAVVLARRSELRGVPAEIQRIGVTESIPDSLDIYTLGGGEDVAQTIASRRLQQEKGLYRAVQNGCPVLAICAAFQILGDWYTDSRGERSPGVGILDAVTLPQGARAIGELVTSARELDLGVSLSETLTGFENHGGSTVLGSQAQPLGFVQAGVGNGQPGVAPELDDGISREARTSPEHGLTVEIPDGYRAFQDGKPIEGAVQGSIIATYMHGPCLARNPQLADLLLARAFGTSIPDLPSMEEIPGVRRLRQERLAAAGLK
ncbi:glutamine amidotransferase [Mobiluncus mulieris]|uniref:Lipid II isoglutaminyl synthase (glutamine-hydrolyzing) subunit GatD n=2 Tax=Mobiluncus mulieris TaxID=2052 RepID=A0ABD4TW18_9ACTO|nr:glutamine amidotransferase [Mobiluncus mulieris]MCU9973573.1 glutamine amidotransferase [Mobiluncus mulieris]MCV0009506.1 glutamine amidotransferase [Mobiluncus mulieris]NMW75341.1 glutamine amidotransferase [Mobiluncus mulieris]NMW81585.1 glutamine amidotransferase [Mobiluncus mulieris]